ncbi:MAG: hypothetical protein LBF84_02175 [Holosporales bacterium]|nr:hypothetical protein [Holosporales bacterium]
MSVLISLAFSIQSETFSAAAFSAPFKCLRIFFSAVLGFLFFSEKISFVHLVGIMSIVCSYVFICKNCGKTTSYYIQKKGRRALRS